MIAELRVIASAWLGWLADTVSPADPVPPWPEDQPLGEYPPFVPAAGAGPPAGGGHPNPHHGIAPRRCKRRGARPPTTTREEMQ